MKMKQIKPNFDNMMLYSAMFSLNYYKGFSVLRSMSTDETAFIICNMVYKMGKTNEPSHYLNGLSNEVVETKDYCKVIKTVKKDNITVENIGEIMLCQIPGISSVTAIAILTKFKTLPNLITEINTNPDCLKDISYTTSAGQTRKISKSCILSIHKFLETTHTNEK